MTTVPAICQPTTSSLLTICGRVFSTPAEGAHFIYIRDTDNENTLKTIIANVGTQFDVKTMVWDGTSFVVEELSVRDINKVLM